MGLKINQSPLEQEFEQSRRHEELVFIGVALLLGSVFLLVGVGCACSSISIVSVAKQTEGKVIRMAWTDDGPTAPVVEFFLDGQRHEVKSSFGGSMPDFKIGDKVRVLYDPNDPKRCRINSFEELWLTSIIFGGIGLLTATISGTALVGKWKDRKRNVDLS